MYYRQVENVYYRQAEMPMDKSVYNSYHVLWGKNCICSWADLVPVEKTFLSFLDIQVSSNVQRFTVKKNPTNSKCIKWLENSI